MGGYNYRSGPGQSGMVMVAGYYRSREESLGVGRAGRRVWMVLEENTMLEVVPFEPMAVG